MSSRIIRTLLIVCTLACMADVVCAQRMPERHLVRRGNRQFDKGNFARSEEFYKRALEADPTSFEAQYDLAGAQFRQERYEAAEKTLSKLASDTTRTDIERGEVAYNTGNAQFAQQKLKEALASYRHAMRLNPADVDAKYNYALTKALLQAQQQQEQNQDQNQEQNQNDQDKQNQNQNQDQNQGQQNGQDSEDKQEGQQDRQPQNDEQEQQGEQQPGPQSGISDQEQAAMLDAIQAQEDKTQDKLKEKAAVLVRGTKNW